MGSIAGQFNFDGRPVAAIDVRRMCAGSGRPSLDGEDVWIGSSFGVGYQHHRVTPESLGEAQPLVTYSGAVACFDGRLDNRAELARVSSSGVPASHEAPDVALVAALYEQLGDPFVAEINGEFALALFNPSRQRLVLARDVMSARCLYYCSLPGTLLFASTIKSLLAHPRVSAAPDEEGLADLVLNHWCDDHRTCFKGIFSVPPGHSLICSRDGIRIREHWAFDPSREIRFRTFGEYRDAFRALFEQAVRRRLRSAHPVAVAVGGGVDSSAIFCEAATLIREKSLPLSLHGIAMTFPPGSAADEREFVSELEKAYGTRMTRVEVSRLRFLANADAIVRQTEMPGMVWQTQGEIFERARRSGCRVILNGFFGDQMLFATGYLVDLARRGRWMKVRHDLREFAAWMTDVEPKFFEHTFRGRFVRALPPRWMFRLVKRQLMRWRGDSHYPSWFSKELRRHALARQSNARTVARRFASHHAEQYHQHVTAGHYVSNVQRQRGAGLMHGIEVSYPFRDRDLVAFLMAIPGEIVNWQGVPKGLLRHALNGILPGAVRNRRWKADFTAMYNQGMRHDEAGFARLLSRDCLSVRAGFVDDKALETCLRTFAGALVDDEGVSPGWEIVDIAGLELWLQTFFGRRSELVSDPNLSAYQLSG